MWSGRNKIRSNYSESNNVWKIHWRINSYTRKYEKTKGDSSSYMGLKSSKTRFEQSEGDKSTENWIFDFVTIFKKAQMDEHKPKVDFMEKYYKTRKELKY